jgi:probable selenium-dependent hydroxylase accessory protein YqeC
LKPEDGSYIENEKQLWDRWNSGKPAVAGQRAEGGKLSMLPESVLQQYSRMADIVFLEADGSKRLPLKVPAKQEPVLTEKSDIVIALCGMNALGKPLAEVCFRLQEACGLLEKDKEDRVSAEDLARILTSPLGSLKQVDRRAAGPREYYMVLNQCDDGLRLKQAAEIISMVRAESTGSILASCLKEQGEFAD